MTRQTELKSEQLLYLEDLQVGQRFVTGSHVISENEIRAFAAQFDPQPFHLDDAAAKRSIFGGLAASGWHTAAITMRLLVESGPRLAGGIIGSHGYITWLQPTRPGDVLTAESEVLDVTPCLAKPGRGLVTLRSKTRNQRGEIMSFKLLAKRRSASGIQDDSKGIRSAAWPTQAVAQLAATGSSCPQEST
jgi:acyl dehydratase